MLKLFQCAETDDVRTNTKGKVEAEIGANINLYKLYCIDALKQGLKRSFRLFLW